jgi:hypothetical protein
MKKNVGTTDKVIRILLAAAIVVLFFLNIISGVLGIILLIVAGILVVTSIFSICPLYLALRINTRPGETAKKAG